MGCRLHWARTYKIEWEGGWFNWNAPVLKAILRYFEIEIWEAENGDGDYGDFEMSVEEFKKLQSIVKESRNTDAYEQPVCTRSDLEENGYCEGESEVYIMTYKNLDDWLKEVRGTYDSDNDYIRFTWF